MLKNTCPTKFVRKGAEQVSVSNGDGDGNSFFLVSPFLYGSYIQIILHL